MTDVPSTSGAEGGMGQQLRSYFDIPDAAVWRPGYKRVAADVPDLKERTLEPALSLAKAFLDPILQGDLQHAHWDPAHKRWQPTTT